MRRIRFAAATVGLALLVACGSQPAIPPPAAPASGIPVETHLLTTPWRPTILPSSILAASDLDTLRALVNVMRPGGSSTLAQCGPPYEEGSDVCWPGAQSQAGRAYLALVLDGGWCQYPSRPQLYLLPGRRLLLQVGFSKGFCFSGSAAAPLPHANLVAASGSTRASLVSILTTGLAAGLYAVSYRFLANGRTYDSDWTYLSVPGPVAASQSTIEAQVAALLAATDRGGPLVSVARVTGDQVGDLCGESVDGPAYLLTAGTDLWSLHRQMKVVLAGPTQHTCAVTSI